MEKDRKGVSGALGVLQTAVVLRVIRKKVTLEKGLEMKELSTHVWEERSRQMEHQVQRP